MKEQIEKKACKNCIHFQMCVDTFRKAKQDGEILLIEEDAYFADAGGCDFYADKRIYRKQSEGELRVETVTDDFTDMELAKERGWYRKRFYCPNCDLLIKTESWDRNYMFGCGTVLKSNDMPNFCPNCGAKMKGGAE